MTLRQVFHSLVPWRLRVLVLDALWRMMRPRFSTTTGLPIEIKSLQDWGLYVEIFVGEEYDAAITEALDDPEPKPLVLDLGASVGYFGLRFGHLWLRRYGIARPFRLIGIEGSPRNYAELRRRLSMLPLVDLFECHLGLVGSRSGEGFLHTPVFYAENSIVARSARRGYRVPFLNLDDIVPSPQRIALLKCDIEGAEEMFISTYPDLLGRVERAVFEFHGELCDVNRSLALLAQAGFAHRRLKTISESVTLDYFVRMDRTPPDSASTKQIKP